MSGAIASRLVSHDLPGLTAVISQSPLEEPLCCSVIPLRFEKYIHHVTVLVDGPPQIMLLTIDLDENLVDE